MFCGCAVSVMWFGSCLLVGRTCYFNLLRSMTSNKKKKLYRKLARNMDFDLAQKVIQVPRPALADPPVVWDGFKAVLEAANNHLNVDAEEFVRKLREHLESKENSNKSSNKSSTGQ